jgi:splicing factor 1
MICKLCGGIGHLPRDCKFRNDPAAIEAARKRENMMDSEYASLMAELGTDQGVFYL